MTLLLCKSQAMSGKKTAFFLTLCLTSASSFQTISFKQSCQIHLNSSTLCRWKYSKTRDTRWKTVFFSLVALLSPNILVLILLRFALSLFCSKFFGSTTFLKVSIFISLYLGYLGSILIRKLWAPYIEKYALKKL